MMNHVSIAEVKHHYAVGQRQHLQQLGSGSGAAKADQD